MSFLFDSIFFETHPELDNLQHMFSKLKMAYQTDEIKNEDNSMLLEFENDENDNEDNSEDDSRRNDDDENDDEFKNDVLTKEQIKKFKNIYNKKFIETNEDEDDEKSEGKNEEVDIFMENLQKFHCSDNCIKNLNLTKIKLRYESFNTLSKTEQDMYLLGIISSTIVNNPEKEKSRLKNNYSFEGTNICRDAFLTIHNIGAKRWKNIRSHYLENDIKIRQNLLSGRVGNRATSFDSILKILTFIINFANVNGLPSPGKCFLLKFY
jgi:hypothetical protein